jgi:signal transduction histidine kinase
MTDSSRLTALQDACQRVAASAEFAPALADTLRLAQSLSRADSVLLALYNKNTNQWFVHSHSGLTTETLTGRTELAVQAASTAQAVGNEFALALPLQARGRVVGALGLSRGDGFQADDRLALEVFATAAALAIDGTLSKTDFVSTVTHELRLPMTSIKGYTDLIRGGMAGPVSDMQKQLLDTVRNNVDWMNSLVSDLSDIAKVETGRLKVNLDSVDAADVIRETVSASQTQFESKTQTLAAQIPGSLPKVLVDRQRLTQMLQYMLTNAHRYTAANGQITVKAEAENGRVKISVTDTGVGMQPDDKARLFNQFFRSEDPVVRDHKGWGLALHLVKRLTELFGGEIGAESEYGKGSTFWFTLPVSE